MASEDGVIRGEDGKDRCFWGAGSADYQAYHDGEWGRPVADDVRLFEKICLEGFQSGLSWLTILRKRANFRLAFGGFDIETVAAFGTADISRLLADAGIVRNRAKIEAAIANARAALELPEGLADRVWKYATGQRSAPRTLADVPAVTPESKALAKDLRTAGFRFTGPVTAYATMQACGVVNDHLADCVCRDTRAADSRSGR